MRLFHITCYHHMAKIFEDDLITTTESNIGAPDIMNLKLHENIAKQEKVDNDDPPLVMVWHPNHPGEVLTIPRDLLAKIEEAGRKNFRRLTQREINTEVGDGKSYVAKIVVDVELNVTQDGKFGDIISDTNASSDDLAPYGEHLGPDVVWLTRDITPRQAWASPGGHSWEEHPEMYRKDSILIEVNVPDEEVHKWSEWAFEQGINPNWYYALALGLDEHLDWFVIERPIPFEEWTGVWDLNNSACLWLPPGTLPAGQQKEGGWVKDGFRDIPLPESWVPTRLRTKGHN